MKRDIHDKNRFPFVGMEINYRDCCILQSPVPIECKLEDVLATDFC